MTTGNGYPRGGGLSVGILVFSGGYAKRSSASHEWCKRTRKRSFRGIMFDDLIARGVNAEDSLLRHDNVHGQLFPGERIALNT